MDSFSHAASRMITMPKKGLDVNRGREVRTYLLA
jgi:hypothetical protein